MEKLLKLFSPQFPLGEEEGFYVTGNPHDPIQIPPGVFAPRYPIIGVEWIYHIQAPQPLISYFPIERILESMVTFDPHISGDDVFFQIVEEVVPTRYLNDENFLFTAQSFFEEFCYHFYKYLETILPGQSDSYKFKQWIGRDHVMLERIF